MNASQVLTQKVVAGLGRLPGPEILKVLDFVDFLEARSRSAVQKSDAEDPILRVAGCLSGIPLSAEQIEKELYGKNTAYARTDFGRYLGLDRSGTPRRSPPK